MSISNQCSRCGVQTLAEVISEHMEILDYRKRNAKRVIDKGDPLCSMCRNSDKVIKCNSVNAGLIKDGFW